MRYACLLTAVTLLIACAKSVEHDEIAARKRALEFAQTVLLNQDFEGGYALLSDGGRRYLPLDKFKETLLRLHPRRFPVTVGATEYEPMPGETAIYIYLTGENSGEHFSYTVTLEGSAANGYRVSRLTRGTGVLSSGKDRRKFSNNISRASE